MSFSFFLFFWEGAPSGAVLKNLEENLENVPQEDQIPPAGYPGHRGHLNTPKDTRRGGRV